ncbi:MULTISPECIES: aldose epimerase family protein [Sphingomonas]|uniref:Aldose 1-epimerase n=1 Tax=Sphingomonas kyungheensis TaxID=1069987 RepID=A0ABU8GY57_9SPHN|nr:aldose epimerase family protein [Sphingomonas sp. RIT328]EZP50191.1 Aldose 1-epimerase [Sphingomonas sp. RIT328]
MKLRKAIFIAGAGLTALAAAQADAATTQREAAGRLADGTAIEAVTLTAANGVSARVLTYGATLQKLSGPDRDGKIADVLLGYDDAADYAAHPNYFGVTVGRFANRIGGGKFTLDGKTYQLPLNDKVNSLHGGQVGFDKRLWRIVSAKDGSATLALTSADGDQGYPGKLDVTVTYTMADDGALTIAFGAKTDKPTVVNMTNHGIFNLAGEGSPLGILNQRLTIPAKAITPVDANLVPTGELRPVAGTVFDFRSGRMLGEGVRDGHDPQIVMGHGYDHNFALDKGLTATPQLAARLEDPVSGRVLEVSSTEPGVQMYTGNFLDGSYIGKNRHVYRMGDGVALEPQKFPDAPNKPNFASARVDPGKPYRHVMIYKLSVAK